MTSLKKFALLLCSAVALLATSTVNAGSFFPERTAEGRVYTQVFGKVFEVTDHAKMASKSEKLYEACIIMHADELGQVDGNVTLVNYFGQGEWFSRRLQHFGEVSLGAYKVNSINC